MEAERKQAKHRAPEVKDSILGSPPGHCYQVRNQMRLTPLVMGTWLRVTCLKIAPCLVSHFPPATVPFLLTRKSAEKCHSPCHAGAAPLTLLGLSLHPCDHTELTEAARDQHFLMLFTTHECPLHQMAQEWV